MRGWMCRGPSTAWLKLSNPDQTLACSLFESLRLNTCGGSQATTQLLLASEGMGRWNVQARIDDPTGGATFQANFVSSNKLDILGPFWLRSEQLRGEVNGRGRSVRHFAEPWNHGDIRLHDGHVSGPELLSAWTKIPTMSNSPVIFRLPRKRAQIGGNGRSGAQRQGSLQGSCLAAPELISI